MAKSTESDIHMILQRTAIVHGNLIHDLNLYPWYAKLGALRDTMFGVLARKLWKYMRMRRTSQSLSFRHPIIYVLTSKRLSKAIAENFGAKRDFSG